MKATHKGECQICGSVQKLPNGVLSLHGYTKQWGFFSGICHGAGHLPFEQSKDQIAGVIASVEKQIAEVSTLIAALEDINSEVNASSKAWYACYKGSSRQGSIYIWEQCEVVKFEAKVYSSRSCYYAKIVASEQRHNKIEAREQNIEAYDQAWNLPSVRHWVHFLNCKYAKHLRKELESRRGWVSWQNQRVANWSVKPLKPVS